MVLGRPGDIATGPDTHLRILTIRQTSCSVTYDLTRYITQRIPCQALPSATLFWRKQTQLLWVYVLQDRAPEMRQAWVIS